jgi:hypothetical protein
MWNITVSLHHMSSTARSAKPTRVGVCKGKVWPNTLI